MLKNIASVSLMAIAQRPVIDRGIEEDLTPSKAIRAPHAEAPHVSHHRRRDI
jgi:hypothetical protein